MEPNGGRFLCDAVTMLACTVDGRAVNDLWSYRADSPRGGFALDLPADNLLDALPWYRYPCISDGYWLMLKPLDRGVHTVRFSSASPTISLDMTYHITVQKARHHDGDRDDDDRDGGCGDR